MNENGNITAISLFSNPHKHFNHVIFILCVKAVIILMFAYKYSVINKRLYGISESAGSVYISMQFKRRVT